MNGDFMKKKLFILAINILIIPFYGYTLSVMWDWFIAVQFDLKPISIPMAIGIASTVKLFAGYNVEETDEEKDIAYLVIFSFIKPPIILLVGYIILQFV